MQYSVLRLDEETEEIQAGYQTAKFGSYFISERNMPKMNGISPPATIHRRLNNNELPIKKTGEIQEFWIFSAPPRAKALRIKPLRAPRTAIFAVIRRETPQRPPPICRLPPTIYAEYARSRWNTRKKKAGCPSQTDTPLMKYDYLVKKEVKPLL